MDNSLINGCMPIVRELISEQNRFSEVFRDRYEHTIRVLTWAKRIQSIEGGDLNVITLAVLFHDTGWSEEVNHAQVSALLAEEFLLENKAEAQFVERVVSAVRTHNLREIPSSDLPIENQVVMDADLLDELGVTTLVWDAMSVAQKPDLGYQKVLEKDIEFFSSAWKKRCEIKTKTGLKFYLERMDFWRMVLENLAYELGDKSVRIPKYH